jgi:hypothetical protein
MNNVKRDQTAEEYSNWVDTTFPEFSKWNSSEPFYLYKNCSVRFKVQYEQRPLEGVGIAIERDLQLADLGVVCEDQDNKDFLDTFISKFVNRLSLHDLEHLIAGLEKCASDWRTEIMMSKLKSIK